MNDTQLFLTISYGLLVLATVVFAVKVVRSTEEKRRRTGHEFDLELATKRENGFAWLIVGLLVALLVATPFGIPYTETSAGEDGKVVEIEAFQFGWTVEPSSVPVDTEIEFRARSRDVQHGFGIYRGTELLAQVQVPARRPGSDSEFGDDQHLVVEFDEPGTYDILCLEFCGSKHHAMAAQIEVTQ